MSNIAHFDRSRLRKVVLCHGVFDLLHLGHIRHLHEAKALGDWLVVSVTSDRFVNKGNGRPHFTAEQRAEALRALNVVDQVLITDAPTAADTIKQIRPDIYVKGIDYANRGDDEKLCLERAAVEFVGGRLHVTTAEKWSSTDLLRTIKMPAEASRYLETARARDFLPQILAGFETADKLRIVFVGETIIDEYRYVKPLGRPSKEFVLATVNVDSERFEGGVIAASRHAEWKNVGIVTSASTITKTRFVDADFSRKLFEVYSGVQIEKPSAVLLESLKAKANAADVCVAMDFGHGFFGEVELTAVSRPRFLAVTAQSNAANQGFNPVTRHPRADYVVVDEPEARFAAQDRHSPISKILGTLQLRLRSDTVTITRGRFGSASLSADGDLVDIPAFADGGLDTMGAGDAFIAIAAPLVAAGLPVELAVFAGNVAGGLKTSILGHRRHITRDDLVKNLEWLLK